MQKRKESHQSDQLTRMAMINPDTVNEENRTVEVVWSKGAPVKRYDWRGDYYYVEELVVSEDAIRMERLNNKAPLLNNHSAYDLDSVIGVVEPNSVRIENGEAIATIRFSNRKDVNPIWQDVRDGIISKVSVGYKIYGYQEVDASDDGELPRRMINDWEPYELSMVCIAADDGAGTRSDVNEMENRAKEMENNPMTEEELKVAREKEEAARKAEEKKIRKEAREKALKDVREATNLVNALYRGDSDAIVKNSEQSRKMLIDDGKTLDEVREYLINNVAENDEKTETQVRVTVDGDERKHNRFFSALTNVVEVMMSRGGEVGDDVKQLGLERLAKRSSFSAIAEEILAFRGIRSNQFSRDELFRIMTSHREATSLTRAATGYHSTDDFSNLMGTNVGRMLRREYDIAPQTFRPFTTIGVLRDFRPSSRIQTGDYPALVKKSENTEIKYGTSSDSKETIQLATYASGIALTRELFINDDLDGLMRMIRSSAQAAANLESDLVYGVINTNGNMADGNPLFSAAHGNIGTAGALSVATLSELREKLLKMKTLDNQSYINLMMKFIVVPASLQTEAQKLIATNLYPAQTANENPFRNLNLEVIAEPRLTDNAGTSRPWYVIADPASVDTIELARLEGQTGIEMRQEDDINTLGIKYVAYMDVAAKAIDWRGMTKNPYAG